MRSGCNLDAAWMRSGCDLDAIWMRFLNTIFDILEPSAFQKYSTCWVFSELVFVFVFVFVVFVFVFVFVFVNCNAITKLDYIYLLQHRMIELIHTGRLAFESSCLCLRICLCVCLCLCLSRHQMNPGAVPFPTMYNMFNMVLEP